MSAWEELICVCIAHPGCATSDHHTSTNGLTVHHHGRDLPVTKLGWIQWWLAQHGEPKFPSCLAVITPTFLGIKTPSCFMVLGSKGIYIYIYLIIYLNTLLYYTLWTHGSKMDLKEGHIHNLSKLSRCPVVCPFTFLAMRLCRRWKFRPSVDAQPLHQALSIINYNIYI